MAKVFLKLEINQEILDYCNERNISINLFAEKAVSLLYRETLDPMICIDPSLIKTMVRPKYHDFMLNNVVDPRPKSLNKSFKVPKPSLFQRIKRKIFGPPKFAYKGDLYGFKK